MVTEAEAFFVSKLTGFCAQVKADTTHACHAQHAAQAVILIDNLIDAYGTMCNVVKVFSANSYDARSEFGIEATMLRTVAEYAISMLHEGYDALLEKIGESFYPPVVVGVAKTKSAQLEDCHNIPKLWDHHGRALHETSHFIKTSSGLAIAQIAHFTDSNAEALESSIADLVLSGLGDSMFFKSSIVHAMSCLAFRNAPMDDPARLAILPYIDQRKECNLRFSEMIEKIRQSTLNGMVKDSVDAFIDCYRSLTIDNKENLKVSIANHFFVMQMSTQRSANCLNMCESLGYFFNAMAAQGVDVLLLTGLQNFTDSKKVMIMTRDLAKMLGQDQSFPPEFAAIYAGILLSLSNHRLLEMDLSADALLTLYGLKKAECFREAMLTRGMSDTVLALDLGL